MNPRHLMAGLVTLISFVACGSDPEPDTSEGGGGEGATGQGAGSQGAGASDPCNGAQGGTLEHCKCTCGDTASQAWYGGIAGPFITCSDLEGSACTPGDPLPESGGAGGSGGANDTWTGCEVIATMIDCGP